MTAVSGPGADAYIDPFAGSSVPGLFGMPTYEFYAYAETGGYAMDPAPSAAEASAYAGYTIDIDNAGSTGYTIFGELSYVLDAEAFVDTPSLEDAYSEVTVSLVDELGTVLFEDVFGFTAGPLDGFGDGGTVMPPSVGVEFFVAAGDYKTLTLEVTSMGEASAVVPLPAAAWLFGAAILGMAGFVTRRNNA
jgi:hypothetical protein